MSATNSFPRGAEKAKALLPLLLAYALQGAKTPAAFSLVFLATGFLFLESGNRTDLRLPKTILIAFLGYFFWSWLSLIHNPPLDNFLSSTARVFLYFMFACVVASSDDETQLLIPTTVLSLAVIEACLVRLNYHRLYLVHMEQFGGALANPLHSGILIPVGFVALIAFALKRWTKPAEWVAGGAIALLLAYAAYLLRSRSAVLAMAFIPVVLGFRRYRRAFFVAAAVGVVVFIFVPKGPLFDYLEIDRFGMLSTLGRFSIWKTDLLAIRDHPWVGYGLGNFEYAFLRHQQPSAEFFRYAKSTIFAHNGLLQTAVDSGLPALFLLILGLLSTARMAMNREMDPLLRTWTLLVFAVYGLASLFNYSLFLPFNGLVFSACIGIVLAKAPRADVSLNEPKIRILNFSLLALFTLYSLLSGAAAICAGRGRLEAATTILPIRASYWYDRAVSDIDAWVEKRDSAFFVRAVGELKQSLRWNDKDPYTWSRYARLLASTTNGAHDEAEFAFNRAISIAPRHAPFWVEFGFYSLSINDVSRAERCFSRAAELEPSAPLAYYGLALVKWREGDSKKGIDLLDQATDLKRKQPEAEAASSYNRELLATPYGEFLYGIDPHAVEALRHRLLAASPTRS